MSSSSSRAFFPETDGDLLKIQRIVQPGLRIARLTELAKKLNLKVEELARRYGLSRATFHRREADHKPLSPA